MKHPIHTVAALAFWGFLSGPSADAQTLIGPATWLDSQAKPAFRPGHTLPRLTRYGWDFPVDVRQKLCEDWGYALEFGVAKKNAADPYDLVWQLNWPDSAASKMAALHLSDPARYPLAVEISKRMPQESDSPPVGTFARKADGTIIYKGSYTLPDGNVIGAGPVYSLQATDATWELAAEFRNTGLRELQSRGISIAYTLNGGEYGPGSLAENNPFWGQEPSFSAGVNASPWGQGSAWEYCSARLANIEHTIQKSVNAQVPQRNLHLVYTHIPSLDF